MPNDLEGISPEFLAIESMAIMLVTAEITESRMPKMLSDPEFCHAVLPYVLGWLHAFIQLLAEAYGMTTVELWQGFCAETYIQRGDS